MPALPLLTRKAGILHIQSQYRLAHTTTIRSTYAWPFYVLSLTYVSSRAARYTSRVLKCASRAPGYTPGSQDVSQTPEIYQAEYYKEPKKLLSSICFVHFLLLFLAKPDTFSKFAS